MRAETLLAATFLLSFALLSWALRLLTASRRAVDLRLQALAPPRRDEEEERGEGAARVWLRVLRQTIRTSLASREVTLRLNRAGLGRYEPGDYYLAKVLAVAVPGLLALSLGGPVAAAAAAAAGFLAPDFVLARLAARRLAAFEGQLVDALTVISSSLKSGHSFLQALNTVAREMPDPLGGEFAKVLRQINLGHDLEAVLVDLTERVPSGDLELAVTAILIHREVGGNLSHILDNIITTIRERVEIRGQVRTLTAQGRLSGLIVSLLPLALGLFMFVVNPEYMRPLWTEGIGRLMLGLALVFEVLGLWWIRKIVDVRL